MTDKVELIRLYASPHNARTNPHGNPFGITLPEDFASIRSDETVDHYRQRIADGITLSQYPQLRESA